MESQDKLGTRGVTIITERIRARLETKIATLIDMATRAPEVVMSHTYIREGAMNHGRHIELQELSEFHDATITSFQWKYDNIEIEFEGVSIDDRLFQASLRILQVTNILMDNRPIMHQKISLMEASDGGVLTLRILGKNMFLLAEWPDYINHGADTIRTYHISGEDISILIGDEIQRS